MIFWSALFLMRSRICRKEDHLICSDPVRDREVECSEIIITQAIDAQLAFFSMSWMPGEISPHKS